MRFVIISNRLPVTLVEENDMLQYKSSAGGLVTGLMAYLENLENTGFQGADYTWVGWPGSDIEEAMYDDVRTKMMNDYKSFPVFMSSKLVDDFYHGFCNRTIWPLFHYFMAKTVCDEGYWNAYKKVNELFCQGVEDMVKPDDVLWVQDYHLMLLPRMLRERGIMNPIGFFLHIPFPDFEVFRMLPSKWSRDILNGLLGADLVGFHTHDYAQYFLRSVQRILGYDHKMGELVAGDNVVRVDSFPMGIDFERFNNAAASEEVQQEKRSLKSKLQDYKVILSVDRLDYTKGVLNRLKGYEAFLEMYPEWHRKVMLVMVVVPSRIGVDHYREMKKNIDELVGRINGRFGSLDWLPTSYQYNFLPFDRLVALYNTSDVALITPLRDGMNLIAKEYLASRTDQTGVLILSERAGAARELGEALSINPTSREEIAEALKVALEMPVEEQKKRNALLQARLKRYNVVRWADEFINQLQSAKDEQKKFRASLLGSDDRKKLLKDFTASSKRLIFLDYDGTLRPFVGNPKDAKPDDRILSMLKQFNEDPKSDVVIISGRDKDTLENWLGELDLNIVAEHGAYIKHRGKTWKSLKPTSLEWKPQLRHVLELYVDRLPGSLIEEKACSLVWHYRKCDPIQGSMLEKELMDDLVRRTANMDLHVMQGSKVVEVRVAGINKGAGGLRFLRNRENEYDFILSIGDDWTDEDLFQVLPDRAHTIRVGMTQTHARHNLQGPEEVMELLEQLIACNGQVSKI